MKIITIILALLALSGCATIHDYCVSHAGNYSSYNECYSERYEAKRARTEALSHMGDGLKNVNYGCSTFGDNVSCR